MKYFIISDVHGNLEAFEAVLAQIEASANGEYRIVSLGDIVGYGPDPNRCIELTTQVAFVSVLGNHDYGVLGLTEIELFNSVATKAILWTRNHLTKDGWNGLQRLKDRILISKGIATFTHASPFEPSEWHYIITYGFAKMAFSGMRTPLCFVGHSHQPIFIVEAPGGAIDIIHCQEQSTITYNTNDKYIINVGSVGQPRDGINKACYAEWDDEAQTVSVKRVAYDFKKTQQKICAAGLPTALALRLETGL